MVRIGMGEDQKIDLLDLFLPEKGSDDFPPYVKAVVIESTSIDDRAFALRKFHEGTVSLSNVKKGDPQILIEMSPGEPIGEICNPETENPR